MPRERIDGNAAYDLYRAGQVWEQGTAAPALPELPEQPEQREQALETVVVRARMQVSLLAVLGIVVTVALLVMVISGYVRLYELTSVQAELNDELTALEAEHARLEASYESKLNMEQIELVAGSELGMHLPTEQQIVYLNMSGEDTAVVYDSDAMDVGSVTQALKNGFGYLIDYIRAYFS